jgi:glycosyltransferase involved in cell wall biosynthesis
MPTRRALFLSPETPAPGAGGGGLRSASLLEYLRAHYDVQVFSFHLPHHSKSRWARVWRNGWRFVRAAPPLLDRFAGFESQLDPVLKDPVWNDLASDDQISHDATASGRRYSLGVIEHFWCAPYARALRPHCDRLVLDLHNIESQLAHSHARATRGIESIAMSRFARAYERLEREWPPQFDILLVASEEDRRRVAGLSAADARVIVYPNALPVEWGRRVTFETSGFETTASETIARESEPSGPPTIVFSGNLEYHPNVEAVRWFHAQIWPRIRARAPGVKWTLVGCNEHAVRPLLAGDDRILLTGPVEDAVAELANADVCIVPLLSGSGTRFKILEAWAAARAVVSTSLGAEGLGAKHEQHLLIADSPAAFAEATLRLLDDPALRSRLGEAGRELYLDRFTWPVAWRALESAGI